MKYTIKTCHYVSKSPYTYYVIQADEQLTKFHVWGYIKAFNTMLYTEQQVYDLIEERYPGSVKCEKTIRHRKSNLKK